MLASRRWLGRSMLALAASAALGLGLQNSPFPALDGFLADRPVGPGPLRAGPAAVNLDLADAEIPGAPPIPVGAPRLLVLVNGRQVYVDEGHGGAAAGLAGAPAARSARNLTEGPVWDAPPLRDGGGVVRISLGRLHLLPGAAAIPHRPARKSVAHVAPAQKPAARPGAPHRPLAHRSPPR